jgi:hypothetical protein
MMALYVCRREDMREKKVMMGISTDLKRWAEKFHV